MKIDINEKKENILLSRFEIQGVVHFDKATPSRANVQEALSKELKVDKSLIVIKIIDTAFGDRTAKVTVYQYISKEERDRLEPLTVKAEAEAAKKDAEAKKKAETEAPKEEAPAEKKEEPKEEKKEEPKEEKKEAKEEVKEKKKEDAPKEEKKKEDKKE
ncbi:hypothetical protein GOV09_00515 [Candidatus Woesearchaeota archaeon]|nr:hypothetical protein [Candidatus Woesearchaeota archaeon]